jgi:hypothetical protein
MLGDYLQTCNARGGWRHPLLHGTLTNAGQRCS